MILHVPHSSRALPAAVRRGIALPDAALEHELDLMTDAHTARLAAVAAGEAWIFVNRWSRLVVDPERFPDEREEMRAVGMGAVYTRTAAGAKLRDDDPSLLERYFQPYATGFASLVADRLAAIGRAVIVDVHSYPSRPLPYEPRPSSPRPAVCVGTDPFHTPAELVETARSAFGAIELDTPFSGCYVPLRHYRTDPAVLAVMVEIRRDTYMAEPGGPLTEGFHRIAAALRQFVRALA